MKEHNGLNKMLAVSALALAFFFMWAPYCLAEQVWEEEGVDLVARVTVIEGRLERFNPETNLWEVIVPDTPAGIDDSLYAGADSRAEIFIPNNTVLRIGGDTETRFVSLTETLTDIELLSGTARLYNNSHQTDVFVETPFGRIEVPPGASAELHVDDRAVEIISLTNSVYFASDQSSSRHEAIAGSVSLMAYSDRIVPSDGSTDRSWDAWNRGRDTFWAERRRAPGESKEYLPATLRDEAYVLDTYGSWQRVYYEGAYYRCWRPLRVGFGWTPFSVGVWMNWRGDRVWISSEPFGYVTHHYGNWIYTMGAWYWAPPVSRVMVSVGLPLLNLGFCWYPGRVAWIGVGIQMSWIPLAPFEPYYCHYPWGYRTIVIAKGARHRYAPSHKFKYRRHTVVGRQNHFYADKRGSRVSTWRASNRFSDRSSVTDGKERRTEVRRLRTNSEMKNEYRIRERSKPEGNQVRSRRRPTDADNMQRSGFQNRPRVARTETNTVRAASPERGRQQNRNGYQTKKSEGNRQPAAAPGNTAVSIRPSRSRVARPETNAVRAASPERGRQQNRNGYQTKKSEGNRQPAAVPDNTAVSIQPEKSSQLNGLTVESRNGQSMRQNRYQSSADTFQQSRPQNRSGSSRSNRNVTGGRGDRSYRKR